jgi:hypothetical protein
MLEPTITCTNCQTIIPLTETLARPYIEADAREDAKGKPGTRGGL